MFSLCRYNKYYKISSTCIQKQLFFQKLEDTIHTINKEIEKFLWYDEYELNLEFTNIEFNIPNTKCIKLIFISNKDNKKQLICLGDVIIKELSSTFKLSIEFLREIFKKYNFNISEIN